MRSAVLAVVMTVWRNSKKPMVTNLPASFGHVVAFRCAELQTCAGSLDTFEAHEKSKPWILQPEAVVAILDVEKECLKNDRLTCKLTAASMSVLDVTSTVAGWWPLPENQATQGNACVYKRKRRQKGNLKKKKQKNAAETEPEVPVLGDEEKEKTSASTSKKGKSKKAKKEKMNGASDGVPKSKALKCLKKLKKVEKAKDISFQAENFKKIGRGPTLVVQMMNRLRKLEVDKFKQLSFNLDGVCQFPGDPKMKNVMWPQVVANAHGFFCAVPLDIPDILIHFEYF